MGTKNIIIKNVFFDHDKFLGRRENSLKIYNSPPGKMVLSPFNLTFDSILKLFVLNFDNDPIYFRIELQITRLRDKDCPLVILYRKDNMVDIYYTNEDVINTRMNLLRALFEKVSFNQLETIEYYFQFDDRGLDAYLFLEDKLEKEIEIKVNENYPNRELYTILAPMGVISKKPKYFPIVFLNKFGMVLEKNTEIFVRIHGEYRNLIEMPFQINGMQVYPGHFSLNPIVCNWNKNASNDISPIVLNPPSLTISENNINLALKNNSNYYEIKEISWKDQNNQIVSFEFSPAIPNLISLKNNSKVKGRFSCEINEMKGVFGGAYNISRSGNSIEIRIAPTKGWQLSSGKLWLESYTWKAIIQIEDDGNFKINSYWRRVPG
ncbi:MAG: hypothetical protein EAX91_00865 [Candidatus Lokiarchaeota archaeon]|nr:hypothetical protein [Candidatus Lokiarchaeota archaeon]